MPQHIGIAACSAPGAALCYQTICIEGEALFGAHGHPQVSLHTPPLAAYVACLERDDWPGVAALLLDSARRLAAAGADFLILPDNTLHRALPLVEPHSPRPWLHIAKVVAAEARERGHRRLALTGTRWLLASGVYEEQLAAAGVEWLRPDAAETLELNRIIMEELVRGVFRPESLSYLEQLILRLKLAGCDAVVLGCTELPLVLGDANSPLPTLDSTRLLARAALKRAAAAGG